MIEFASLQAKSIELVYFNRHPNPPFGFNLYVFFTLLRLLSFSAFLKLSEDIGVNENKMLRTILSEVDWLPGFFCEPGKLSDLTLKICYGSNYGHDAAPFRHYMHGAILHRIPCNCH